MSSYDQEPSSSLSRSLSLSSPDNVGDVSNGSALNRSSVSTTLSRKSRSQTMPNRRTLKNSKTFLEKLVFVFNVLSHFTYNNKVREMNEGTYLLNAFYTFDNKTTDLCVRLSGSFTRTFIVLCVTGFIDKFICYDLSQFSPPFTVRIRYSLRFKIQGVRSDRFINNAKISWKIRLAEVVGSNLTPQTFFPKKQYSIKKKHFCTNQNQAASLSDLFILILWQRSMSFIYFLIVLFNIVLYLQRRRTCVYYLLTSNYELSIRV